MAAVRMSPAVVRAALRGGRFSSVMSYIRPYSTGDGSELGRGAGKGGGSGGSIREAGGSFGKREAAQEEQYFRKLQQEQLDKMRDHIHEEIANHQEQLKHHEEAIARHRQRIKDLTVDKK